MARKPLLHNNTAILTSWIERRVFLEERCFLVAANYFWLRNIWPPGWRERDYFALPQHVEAVPHRRQLYAPIFLLPGVVCNKAGLGGRKIGYFPPFLRGREKKHLLLLSSYYFFCLFSSMDSYKRADIKVACTYVRMYVHNYNQLPCMQCYAAVPCMSAEKWFLHPLSSVAATVNMVTMLSNRDCVACLCLLANFFSGCLTHYVDFSTLETHGEKSAQLSPRSTSSSSSSPELHWWLRHKLPTKSVYF